MSITTLIFDLGNVVLTNDWHDNNEIKLKEFRKLFGVTNESMEKGWNTYWPIYEIGKISEDSFWQGFLTKAGVKNIDIDKAKQLWRKYQKPIEQMPKLLKKLKIHYTLAALSNTGKEWLEYKIKAFQINKLFNIIISSASTGIAKPDERIYKIIIDNILSDKYEWMENEIIK